METNQPVLRNDPYRNPYDPHEQVSKEPLSSTIADALFELYSAGEISLNKAQVQAYIQRFVREELIQFIKVHFPPS